VILYFINFKISNQNSKLQKESMFDVTSSSTSNDAPNLDFNFDSVKTEQFKTESVNYNAQFQAPMCSFEMNNINHQDFQFQDAFIPQGWLLQFNFFN
jgi:hypothetical protein